VLEQEAWDLVRLPAIAEEDETHTICSPYGTRVVGRKAGEALHPEREPLPVLEHLRRTLGEYNFSGQYQQSPAPRGGGLVKLAWLRRYVPGEQPAEFDMIFQSWDTANKSTELSDFSVCTTWGRKNKKLYLLHSGPRLFAPPHRTIPRIQSRPSFTYVTIPESSGWRCCEIFSQGPTGAGSIHAPACLPR
jgi:hypothetical protein